MDKGDDSKKEENPKSSIEHRNRLIGKIASMPSEQRMKNEIMELMHKYNETKDAAQIIIGGVANIRKVTIKSVHEELNLPFD